MDKRILACLAVGAAALASCRPGGSGNTASRYLRDSINYVVVAAVPERGLEFVRSLLDGVAERTGVRIEFHVWPAWSRPDASGNSVDLLARIPTPDLVLENRQHLEEWSAAGYYSALDDCLEQYCPNMLRHLQPDFLEANRMHGRLYGVPVEPQRDRSYWIVRSDIRRGTGVPQVGSWPELVTAARAVAATGTVPKPILGDLASPLVEIRCRSELNMRRTPALASLVLYLQGNDGRVHNLLDDIPDSVRRVFDTVRQLRSEGLYVAPAVGARAPGIVDYVSGGDWFAAFLRESKVPVPLSPGPPIHAWVQAQVARSASGAELEVLFEDPADGRHLVDLRSSSFLALPARSTRNPKTLGLLNSLATRDLHELLSYGVEGVHWKAAGVDLYEELGSYSRGGSSVGQAVYAPGSAKPSTSTTVISLWSDRPFEVIRPLSSAPAFFRLPVTMSFEYRSHYLREVRRQDGAVGDVLSGFEFDQRLVWEQVYDYTARWQAIYQRLSMGEIDFEQAWSRLKVEAYDSVKAVQQELQRQIDGHLSRRAMAGP